MEEIVIIAVLLLFGFGLLWTMRLSKKIRDQNITHYNEVLIEKLIEFGYFVMEYDNPKFTTGYFDKQYGLYITDDMMPEEAFKRYLDKYFKEY